MTRTSTEEVSDRWTGNAGRQDGGGCSPPGCRRRGNARRHASRRRRGRPQALTGWIRDNAAPLDTVDPAAPLGDLVPLRRSIGDAEIVGLGESTHGAAEQLTVAPPLRRRWPTLAAFLLLDVG
ncbi:MAG TPA: hypothetical protein VJB61_21520 [Actinomycetota bacterium]